MHTHKHTHTHTTSVRCRHAKTARRRWDSHLLEIDVVHLVARHIAVVDSERRLGRIFAAGTWHAPRDLGLRDPAALADEELPGVVADDARLAIPPADIDGGGQRLRFLVSHGCCARGGIALAPQRSELVRAFPSFVTPSARSP